MSYSKIFMFVYVHVCVCLFFDPDLLLKAVPCFGRKKKKKRRNNMMLASLGQILVQIPLKVPSFTSKSLLVSAVSNMVTQHFRAIVRV